MNELSVGCRRVAGIFFFLFSVSFVFALFFGRFSRPSFFLFCDIHPLTFFFFLIYPARGSGNPHSTRQATDDSVTNVDATTVRTTPRRMAWGRGPRRNCSVDSDWRTIGMVSRESR